MDIENDDPVVTEEMIDAGARAFEWAATEEENRAVFMPWVLVGDVYKAMWLARPKEPQSPLGTAVPVAPATEEGRLVDASLDASGCAAFVDCFVGEAMP